MSDVEREASGEPAHDHICVAANVGGGEGETQQECHLGDIRRLFLDGLGDWELRGLEDEGRFG